MTGHQKTSFATGLDALLSKRQPFPRKCRIGLVSHSAAVHGNGLLSVSRLLDLKAAKLVKVFSPEHGFAGTAGAGVVVKSDMNPDWRIPVVSLYGEQRKPSREMLQELDLLVVDLQDIAARPYTYVSTLRNVLEAAADCRIKVLVTDRPVPLPNTVDGPMREDGFKSFVSHVPLPMSYGMTQAETALWLAKNMPLKPDLEIAPMRAYSRQEQRQPDWPQWIPPSPAMHSWESAWCYTATVFTEAFPQISCGRRSTLPFQVFSALWLNHRETAHWLNEAKLPGVLFHPHTYTERRADGGTDELNGVRMSVTDPAHFQPVATGIAIMSCIRKLGGLQRMWAVKNVRPDFFDLLYGTDSVRKALLDKTPHDEIVESWAGKINNYRKTRSECLLYS